MAPPLTDPRQFADATSLAASVRDGRASADAVVQRHVDRLDRFAPTLNAAVQVFRTAARKGAVPEGATGAKWGRAARTDSAQTDSVQTDSAQTDVASTRDGPLAGVPISLKETFGIQGEPVTAGSIRAPSYVPDADAVVLQRLRAAGAVLLARGNVPEFAMTHETANLRYGATRNPLDPDRSPGGSSGGDAALVGSGSVAAGVGSDVGGSIRYPAHCCGLVGFKPASGVVPTEGTWPPRDAHAPTLFADTFLALGPITRSVRDARLLFEVLADASLDDGPHVKDLRLVVPVDFRMTMHAPVRRAYDAAKRSLASQGVHVSAVRLPNAGRVYHDFLNVLVHDYGDFLVKGLTTEDGEALSFARESWRHLRGEPTVHKYLFRLLAGMQVIAPSASAYQQSVVRLKQFRRDVRRYLGPEGLLFLPTNGALAMRPGRAAAYMARPGTRPLFTPTLYANALDLPAISVPAWGARDAATGLVPGLQLACAPGSDAALFAGARLLERVTA